jgi:hypothetical protein
MAKQTVKILQTVSCQAPGENKAKLKRNLKTATFGYMWTVQRETSCLRARFFVPREVLQGLPLDQLFNFGICATRATHGHALNQNASPVHWGGDKYAARSWKRCATLGFSCTPRSEKVPGLGVCRVRVLFDWGDGVHSTDFEKV